MTQQDKEQLKLEIDHIFESGANEIRIFEMVVNFIDSRNGVNKNFVLADVVGMQAYGIETLKNKYMLELLEEQLQDYLEQKKAIEAECIQLMKEGKEWKKLAKKGVGLKMMIEATLLEIKRLS
jgi:cell shape-determining protein MreC